MALACTCSGCVRTTGPPVLQIAAADYPLAFDAAVEAARQAGMPAVLRDRRGGVIETNVEIAGSIIEPWRTDNASFDQAVENTIAFQRRHARFEFAPTGFRTIDAEHPSVLDLTTQDRDLELRVWVYVERANTPGFRRGAWTRRTASRTILPNFDQPDLSGIGWTPVARDRAYEQRLLADVASQLSSSESLKDG
jgi:hypothetical protein